MPKEIDLKKALEKFDNMKKEDKLDLSSDQDLSVAIMNLVSIEEHLYFTAEKTGKGMYFDFLQEIRQIRQDLLKKIVKDYEGEVWCISKHLLAASMRLMEVATKQQKLGRKKEAGELFDKAYSLYNLFWGLNLKVIDPGKVKNIEEKAISKDDPKKTGFLGKLNDLVKRAIDCCIE